MRVFVDVGAHYGEALGTALDPAWGFDEIFAVEPASVCQSLLRQYRDRRLSIHPVALGKRSGPAVLYGAGLLGASIFELKRQKSALSETSNETIRVVRASDWFREYIADGSQVYMKFNCEGAECDIIEDLLSAGFSDRLASLYIDFDIRKVAGQAHRQQEIERQLQAQGVRYITPVTIGLDGADGVAKWLAGECPRRAPSWMARVRYQLRLHEPPYVRMKSLLLQLLPPSSYRWLGRHFGQLSRTFR